MALSRVSTIQYGAIVRSSTYKPWESGPLPQKSVKESLCVHLTDPKTNEELLILGTLNLSTVLAYHNFESAKRFNPTSVLLQVSPSFESHSQGDFSSSEQFQDALNASGYYWDVAKPGLQGSGFRTALFETRKIWMNLWLNTMLRTPSDIWRLFVPGFDSKLIFELAAKQGSQIIYAGEDFDGSGMESLRTDNRFDVIYPWLKYYFGLNGSWEMEATNMQHLFRTHSLKALVEGHFNQDNTAWMAKFLEKLVPHQKRAIVDRKDEDIFWKIEKNMKGKKKLVLVNQWHMDGVQKLWRSYHGIGEAQKPMMHIKDLPLEEIQGWMHGKDHDISIVEKRTTYPKSISGRENTGYADENRSHYG